MNRLLKIVILLLAIVYLAECVRIKAMSKARQEVDNVKRKYSQFVG